MVKRIYIYTNQWWSIELQVVCTHGKVQRSYVTIDLLYWSSHDTARFELSFCSSSTRRRPLSPSSPDAKLELKIVGSLVQKHLRYFHKTAVTCLERQILLGGQIESVCWKEEFPGLLVNLIILDSIRHSNIIRIIHKCLHLSYCYSFR